MPVLSLPAPSLKNEPGSRYLMSSARTLYDACHEIGRDKGGAACPSCGVKDICQADRARAERRAAALGQPAAF